MIRATPRAATLLLSTILALGPARSRAGEHVAAEAVRAAALAGRPNLSGRDMSGDDLTGIDLSGADLRNADLSEANLHGVKLVGADLTGAKLVGADLTFAWIMRANFTGASLSRATLQTIVTSTAMDNTPDQAASFAGADLSDSNDTVHFSFYDMRGANFARARMTVVMANQSMGLLRSEFVGSNLDGADFRGAGLGHVTFRFAKLRGARFAGADLTDADFTGAYLDGADFSGAKTERASFEAAKLDGVIGLDAAK